MCRILERPETSLNLYHTGSDHCFAAALHGVSSASCPCWQCWKSDSVKTVAGWQFGSGLTSLAVLKLGLSVAKWIAVLPCRVGFGSCRGPEGDTIGPEGGGSGPTNLKPGAYFGPNRPGQLCDNNPAVYSD